MVDVQQLEATQAAAAAAQPRGVWSDAPALAASDTAMTNTSGFFVEVNVTSGTVTAAKRDGTAVTGISATGFRLVLSPGASFSLTYSVAPTLQWLYV